MAPEKDFADRSRRFGDSFDHANRANARAEHSHQKNWQQAVDELGRRVHQ
jgi:hypothetical protein